MIKKRKYVVGEKEKNHVKANLKREMVREERERVR